MPKKSSPDPPSGWPPPMAGWSPRERFAFEQTYRRCLAGGRTATDAFAEAYGAVTRLGPPSGDASQEVAG